MICPYCNKEALWVPNEVIYGRRFGKSFMCYFCKDCSAYVGCHNNTKVALGTMANQELRVWRKKTHDVIDPIWRGGLMTRKEVYQKLSDGFGFEVHVGASDVDMCKQIIEFFGEDS